MAHATPARPRTLILLALACLGLGSVLGASAALAERAASCEVADA